jgi:hypothetical protein
MEQENNPNIGDEEEHLNKLAREEWRAEQAFEDERGN